MAMSQSKSHSIDFSDDGEAYSSFLLWVKWQGDDGEEAADMNVVINSDGQNKWYIVKDVTKEDFIAFKKAADENQDKWPSAGSYFNTVIKNNYDVIKYKEGDQIVKDLKEI